MTRTQSLLLALAFLPLIAATPAYAQSADNAQVMERLDHIEHDQMLLQRQLSRGGSAPVSGDAGSNGSADLEVRLSALEEQQRDLRGQVEQNDFQVKKLTATLEKMQKDTDFRFNELSNTAPAAPAAAAAAPDAKSTKVIKLSDKQAPDGPTTAGDGVLKAPESGKEETSFATPREHYNYAFRLLNQTQYEEAAASFAAFTKKYPKDPLIGNAFYWEGETYYIRRDYVTAADNFRQGFEAAPDGPKAADNLLKLAMSLDALNRDKEACVVLEQITTKFKKSSSSVTEKADQEQKRIGCH